MPANYVLLEKIVVGAAGASSVTFSGIPQTGYTDLVLKTSTRNSGANVGNYSAFTIAGAYNPSGLFVRGNGTATSSGNSQYGQMETGGGATANSFSNTETYFPNYTSATYKSLSSDSAVENNAAEGYNNISAGVVANTSAITSLTITAATGTFVQYSTFYLYGVAALGTTPAISPKATGGSIIETDGTYWYHAFLASGTFTPAVALSCDVLVVAGGGGGGHRNNAGGGGAGGVLAFASQSVATSAQTVTVGAGGAYNSSGTNSQFASLTASVGGGGGGSQSGTANGGNGGSGGGAGWTGTAGTATSGQGNNGGSANEVIYNTSGGGGGKGSVGANGNGTTGTAGAGGSGVDTVTNWGALSGALTTLGLGVSGFIAGGGGGSSTLSGGQGAAGSGGGTAGSYSTTSANATANTGSGSGGVNNTFVGAGNGGSGLVIVRYAV
jgi:hypothetical protein